MIMGEMKRISAPKFWKIGRKKGKFVTCPNPGPHAKSACLPLGVLLRDYLKICENQKDASIILNKGIVIVNGKTRKGAKFPVGMMDIVKIGELVCRIVPGKRGIGPKEVTDGSIRLCKVMGKKHVKGGKTQINLSAGENMLIEKDEYSTGDVIVIDMEKKSIIETIKLGKGSLVLITGGKNMGELGVVESIDVIKNPLPTLVTLRLGERSVKVPKDYVFAVGRDKPVVQM
jgi:small subunit ribosomal protein S4e